MRVVHVIPNFGLGGAEVMCENLLLELRRRNHEVLAVSLYADQTKITDRLRSSGIEVQFLGKKRGADPSIIMKLRKGLKEFHPDVIHTHLYALKYAAAASGNLHVPIVHTLHNVAERECSHVDQKINRVLYHYADIIPVSLSHTIQKTVLDLYGIDYSPVIYNGIDLSRCRPKTDYRANSPIKIIHIGRFEEQKNHAAIVQAAKLLKSRQVCFQLIGEGSLCNEIKELVISEGLQNMFSFYGTTDNVFPGLTNSDIFVLPSKWEGMPMTIIEAMGTGLPIIASDVGGVNEMIEDDKSGILISPDPNELYEAILRMLDNEKLRENMGKNALEASKKFSVENMALEYERLYQSVCKCG